MKAKDITPELTEQLVIKGLDFFCRCFWMAADSEMQKKYPRYNEALAGPIDEGLETITGGRMAYELFGRLNLQWIRKSIDTPGEMVNALREYSLFACRLGAPANIGDVEYYFQKRRAREEYDRAHFADLLSKPKPPSWAMKRILERQKRLERLQQLKAPELIIENEWEVFGGRGDFSLVERCWISLRRQEEQHRRAVEKLDWILQNLLEGNTTPALLFIGEELEFSASCYEDWEESSLDSKTGEEKKKKGRLSRFFRKHGDSITLDEEALMADYLLCQSLTQVLEPTTGRA